ncbi:MAG: phage tailspike protein [Citrobacter amalonaticus]|jgi:hypothetical protein|nr:phage tailspike protein [Citrobacter amalonaticus]
MADQPTARVELPYQLYTLARAFKSCANGELYVGKVDMDPRNSANRITVYVENEDQSRTPIAQPIKINYGGYPVNSAGQVVKLVVLETYSIAVYSQPGNLEFYCPRYNPDQLRFDLLGDGAMDLINLKTNQTLHGKGTVNDPLGVQLSSDNGNLLEIRDNGVFYGITPPAEILNLYVDSIDGDDTNPGTRAEPLKTLNRAFALTPATQSNTIHLKAGQQFFFYTHNIYGQRVIRPYGDPFIDGDKVPALSPEIPYYYGEVVNDMNRPIIRPVVNYTTTTHSFSISTLNPMDGGALHIHGCYLNAKPINDVDSGEQPAEWDTTWGRRNTSMIYGNQAGSVILRGCVLFTPLCPEVFRNSPDWDPSKASWWDIAGSSAQGDVAAMQINRCKWVEGGNDKLFNYTGAGSRLYVVGWPTNPIAFTTTYPDLPDDLSSKIMNAGAVYGVIRDADGKPRNILTNFVL